MRLRNLGKLLFYFFFIILLLASFFGGAIADRLFVIKPLDVVYKKIGLEWPDKKSAKKAYSQNFSVADVADKVSPSVVTVSVETRARRILEISPFGGFRSRIEGGSPQDIGSGFVVSEEGLIVTNKHVVSDAAASYKVITSDDKEYEVKSISRDPSNDLAILKIEASDLRPVELGSSSDLRVGQSVIAIGTALGEFRHTVTVGVISGLGRGITAGSMYEGFVEELDGVIQTDAAINPGNSGGPLLDGRGRVIGISVAVAQAAENIGFAIPVDTVKDALSSFDKTGSFASKPYLGVSYQMVSKQTALLNDVPAGAYVVEVMEESPAEGAGIESEDIITEFDSKKLDDGVDLSELIEEKNAGDEVLIVVWRGDGREGEKVELKVTLSGSE